MDEEIKDCPKCGSDNVETFDWHDRDEEWYGCSVWCRNCLNTSRPHDTYEQAISEWNRRVGDKQ